MSPSRLALIFLFICILVASVPASIRAQITNVTNSTSTPIPGAGHNYIRLLSETVDPTNGSLSVRIGTPTPPGRSLSLPFSFAYDSNGALFPWDDGSGSGAAPWKPTISFLSQGGWSYSMPLITWFSGTKPTDVQGQGFCLYTTDYVFQDPSGGRHSLGIATNSRPSSCFNAGLGASVLSGGDDTLRAY